MKAAMKSPKITRFLIMFSFIVEIVLQVKGQDGYPVPQKTENLLFYFQRSHNKNTVVYELNKLPDCKINKDKPVCTYWIRYEEGGIKKELSFLQLKAFGLKWRLTDKAKESFILHFNSFRKREIYLLKTSSTAGYKAYITINGELSELIRLYIKSQNNSLGIPLSIEFIEISGISLKNGESITEQYIP
jgi:hypothetical protein